MGKLLVEIDREALERVRVKLGARSHAEALRKLISEADPQKLVFPAGYEPVPGDVEAALGKPGAVVRLQRVKKLPDTSRAKVTNPGRPKVPYGSLLKKK